MALKFNNFKKFIMWIFIFSRLTHYLRSNDVLLSTWVLVNKDHFNKDVWILQTSHSKIHGCHLVGRNLWSKIIGCVLMVFMIFPTLISWEEQLLLLASAPDSSQWPILFVSGINLPKLLCSCLFLLMPLWGTNSSANVPESGELGSLSCAHMVGGYVAHTAWTVWDAGEALAHPVLTVKDRMVLEWTRERSIHRQDARGSKIGC